MVTTPLDTDMRPLGDMVSFLLAGWGCRSQAWEASWQLWGGRWEGLRPEGRGSIKKYRSTDLFGWGKVQDGSVGIA